MLLLALHVPVTLLYRHGVGLSTPEESAGSLLETQMVNPWVLTREEPCLANCSSSTAPALGVALPVRRHREASTPGGSLAIRATPSWRLHAFLDREAGNVYGLFKKTAVGPVEAVGGPCPSKEVWETLR